jgi:alpha-D-xyloside xylohydrolase
MRSQVQIDRLADGIVVPFENAFLRLELVADDVVRVAYARERSFFERRSLMAAPRRSDPVRFELTQREDDVTIATPRLRVRVDLATAAVAFLDASGQPILVERAGGRTLTPAEVQGEQTFHVRQEWEPAAGEALYGLGQHQHGLFDIKGREVDLWQHNLVAVVPFLVSSQGYGILWDNDSRTRFGELRDPEPIPPAQLIDAAGRPGGLTGSYFAGGAFDRPVATRIDPGINVGDPENVPLPNARVHPDLPEGLVSARWEGEVESQAAGDYVFETQANCGLKLWLDDRLLIDTWRQGWLAWWDVAPVRLAAARRYRLRIEWR